MERSPEELLNDFESDFSNFMVNGKESFNEIKKDVKKTGGNGLESLKALLNLKIVMNDILKIIEIYFSSSVLKIIDELKNKPELEEAIKNYLNFKSTEGKQKRGIVRETDSAEDYLKDGFYDVNELFGSLVEYYAIIKNVGFAADIQEEQKPALLIDNLNSMLQDLLNIEIIIKDNIARIIVKEIRRKKEEIKAKKAA